MDRPGGAICRDRDRPPRGPQPGDLGRRGVRVDDRWRPLRRVDVEAAGRWRVAFARGGGGGGRRRPSVPRLRRRVQLRALGPRRVVAAEPALLGRRPRVLGGRARGRGPVRSVPARPRRLGLQVQDARVAGLRGPQQGYRGVGVVEAAQRQQRPRPEVARARVFRVQRHRLRGDPQRVGGAAAVELRSRCVREAGHGEPARVRPRPSGRGRGLRPGPRRRRRVAAPEGVLAPLLECFCCGRRFVGRGPCGCVLLLGRCTRQRWRAVPCEVDPDPHHRTA